MSASVYCVLDSVASMHLYTSYLYNSSWELKLTVTCGFMVRASGQYNKTGCKKASKKD